MGYSERKQKFGELEKLRGSRVVALLHSDRISDTAIAGVNTHLAQDHLPVFHELLRKFGKVKQIDIWLYTRGGDMNVPWPLLNAVYNYAERVEVLVPFRAHSAGTLIAMGAHKILMSPSAELSPVDPTTANQFNPRDPNNPQSVLGISVEEVTAFIEMAKDTIGIQGSENLVSVLQTLAKDISPIALGNVHRTYMQSREVSKKLLSLHMDVMKEESKVNDIIDKLTKKLYSHLHVINRREAQSIGLDVKDATDEEDTIMWNIYQDFANEVELNTQFNIRGVLGNKSETDLTLKGGFIETTDCSYLYETKNKISQASELPEKVLTGLIQGRQVRSKDLIPGLPVRVDVAAIKSGWILTS